MNNPFRKNVLEAFAAFSSAFRPKMSQILSESIWFSDHTKFKCSIINDWNRKGIRFINDLIDVNSNKLHTKKGLEDSFNIKMTFLCFSSLMRSLPDELKSVEIVKESGPIMPLRMNLALNHPNFQRFAYNACIENRICDIARVNAKQKERWIRDIGCFEDGSMVKVIKATESTRSIMLHYKLVNRFLATNKCLRIINITNDDSCTFCKREPETLAHLVWHCPRVQSFISDIRAWLMIEFRINMNISTRTWFFLTNLSAMETCLTTLSKMVVHEARLNEHCPNLNHLKNKLKLELEVEFQAARSANKLDKFEKKWMPIVRSGGTNQPASGT